jgi:hypothetical protein
MVDHKICSEHTGIFRSYLPIFSLGVQRLYVRTPPKPVPSQVEKGGGGGVNFKKRIEGSADTAVSTLQGSLPRDTGEVFNGL